jgi:capsular polysaccharide transport system permease protein
MVTGGTQIVSLTRRIRAIAIGTGASVRPVVPISVLRFLGSINIWFWAIVGVPTLLGGVYYFGIASDQYLSEAKFVVHGPAKTPVSTIASLFGGGGASLGADDTQIIRDFILSRDAARKLEQQDDLRAVLSRPEGDFLTRYPGPAFWRKDFEALYRTYGHFVTVEVGADSGVATLDVKAYRPEDARRIATALLQDSERLINDLNERARRDALKTFQQEVDSSEARLAQIQDELTAYRVKANLLQPEAEAKGPLALLAELNKDATTAKTQLADAIKNAPKSPQIGLLKTRISSLDKMIGDERAKLTGAGSSVATASTEYERLDLQRQMEEKLVASAVAAREQSRLEAQRQQLYLETIAQPNLADYPLYPKRASSFATLVAACVLAYGILWLLVAGVREHASA